MTIYELLSLSTPPYERRYRSVTDCRWFTNYLFKSIKSRYYLFTKHLKSSYPKF